MQEQTVDITGLRLAARLWGPPDAPPVLALHGWMDSAATFDRLAPRLPDFRIAALDLAGHGRSDDLPPGVPYTFLDWVLQARAAASALGFGRHAVLGHSLGAGIATALAGAWPGEVTRIALLDGFAPRTQEASELPERLAEYAARRDALRATRPRVLRDAEAAAQRLTQTLGIAPDAARVLCSRGLRAVDGGVAFRRDPRIAVGPPMRLARAHMHAFAAQVRCPALLVLPRSGRPIPADALAELRAALPQLQLAELDGGHHVHLEEPEAVATVLRPFLRGA